MKAHIAVDVMTVTHLIRCLERELEELRGQLGTGYFHRDAVYARNRAALYVRELQRRDFERPLFS